VSCQLDIWVGPQTREQVRLTGFLEYWSFFPPAVASYRRGSGSKSTQIKEVMNTTLRKRLAILAVATFFLFGINTRFGVALDSRTPPSTASSRARSSL